MPAAVACFLRRTRVALLLVIAARPARAQSQGGERLRKTDLVRLLSSATLGRDELATLIRRNCLSFTPTGRDRADFLALGADSSLLREIDGCTRRGTTPRQVPAPVRPAARSPVFAATPVAPTAPAAPTVPLVRRAPLSAARTGFSVGVGQHAAVGVHAPLPLLFEVRDTTGAPAVGQEVHLGVTNGHLAATRVVTDSNGRVRVDPMLGPKVGPVQVSAIVGAIERQATLYADPGPAVQLALRCGETSLEGRVALAPGVPVVLRVTAQDAFGNAAPVAGLQAAAGDRGVLRVAFVGADSVGGLVRVEPRGEGSTSLVIVASRRREDVSVTVAKHPVAGATHCP